MINLFLTAGVDTTICRYIRPATRTLKICSDSFAHFGCMEVLLRVSGEVDMCIAAGGNFDVLVTTPAEVPASIQNSPPTCKRFCPRCDAARGERPLDRHCNASDRLRASWYNFFSFSCNCKRLLVLHRNFEQNYHSATMILLH